MVKRLTKRSASPPPPPPDPRAEWLNRERLTDAPPPFPLPTATDVEVHAAVLHEVQSFFAQRNLRPARRILVPGPTGSGKTHKVGITLPHIITADHAERKRQMIAGDELSPHRWAVLVPAHKLGRQVADRYRQHGLKPAIFEGRGDPWKANPKRSYPCTHLESVKLAMQARASITKNVCGKKGPHHQCPDRRGCRYFSQFVDASDADVLIAANTFVFEELPEPLRHDLAGVIIDESFIENADLIGELSVESFRRPALMAWPCRRTNGTEDGIATMRLIGLSDRLVAMLDAYPDGYLPDDAPAQHRLTADDLEELRKLHRKRRIKPRMYPGMPLDKRKQAKRDAEINQYLPKIAVALRMMKDGHASRIRLFTKSTKNGAERGMVLHGQRQVAEWLRDLPVLILDASARKSDVERFFSDVEIAPIPQPALPHQHVHQHLGAFGKGAMTPYKITALTGHARAHIAAGRETLILCHEKNEAEIKAAVPEARVLHHGEYAGDDANGDVDVVMQFGGPFARPRAIAEMATARYGVPVPIANPEHRQCLALMEDGFGVAFERLVYDHPRAQDVHEGIYDNAFVQGGLGRGRGINRSATTPLRGEIFGNVPLPVPLASRRTPSRVPYLVITPWRWNGLGSDIQAPAQPSSTSDNYPSRAFLRVTGEGYR
jgi:putative DNA primase/helicase